MTVCDVCVCVEFICVCVCVCVTMCCVQGLIQGGGRREDQGYPPPPPSVAVSTSRIPLNLSPSIHLKKNFLSQTT